MRLILLLTVFLLLAITPVVAQEVFYFPQVGDGVFAEAEIRFQTTVIFVNTGEDTVLTLEFFGGDGQPLPFDLPPLGINSFFNINLPSGESFSAQTPGAGALQVGYARVMSPTPGVGGTAVFTRSNSTTGQIVYDAGVPASQALTEFSLFVDSTGNRRTGLATVNTGDGPANITMRLRDRALAFDELAMTDVPLEMGVHLPRFVDELVDDPLLADQVGEMEGILTVESDQPLAAVVLRENETALTAFPVVPGVATPATSGSFAFLSGGEVGTSLDLSRENDTVIGVIYRLYDGESLIAAITRGIVTPEDSKHRLPVGDQVKLVNRVEALIVYAGGQLSSGFDLVSG